MSFVSRTCSTWTNAEVRKYAYMAVRETTKDKDDGFPSVMITLDCDRHTSEIDGLESNRRDHHEHEQHAHGCYHILDNRHYFWCSPQLLYLKYSRGVVFSWVLGSWWGPLLLCDFKSVFRSHEYPPPSVELRTYHTVVVFVRACFTHLRGRVSYWSVRTTR